MDFKPSLAFLFACVAAMRATEPTQDPQEFELVRKIHDKILKAPDQGKPVPYRETIPGTDIVLEMTPIPSGDFMIGSPASEKHRNLDEGPQRRVTVPAFWMATHEVTWNAYEIFMFATDQGGDSTADAVSHPTKPYVEMSFGMGRDQYPAISMTQHAANKFCQWLSACTGHFYRLPTEAEWEYACRAGTTSAYSFGDNPAKLSAYAVFSGDKYATVGSKRPNPWGLYDMHGNVAEWTLDQYEADAYGKMKDGSTAPWAKATAPYPHSVRGGSWRDEAPELRSARRQASSPIWKVLDPQLPKSLWYHTSAQFVGFRIVRPTELPSAEEMYRYWNSGVAEDP